MPNVAEVLDARPSERMLRAHFDQHVHEGVAFEVISLEPLVEDVEDRQQSVPRLQCPSTRIRHDHVGAPHLSPQLEEFGGELVLRREMTVEGGDGDTGRLDDLINADIANAAL